MVFEQLKSKIESLKKAKLIGVEAHKNLAPISRPTFKEYQIPKNAKLAGVMILLYPGIRNKTNIVLTKRASYKGTHSNQISFPGGKFEKKDISLQQTAIRETHEEIGLMPQNIEIVKKLTPIYIPPSNFSVDPYMAIMNTSPKFNINHEVQQIIELPIEHLLDAKNLATFKKSTSYGINIDVPCFNYKEHQIWGATAMILNEVKEVLKNI